jgi:hypothetical protein
METPPRRKWRGWLIWLPAILGIALLGAVAWVIWELLKGID